jgi:hypothetical protein
MTPERRRAVRKWVRETRARQGLPPTITDPSVLDQILAVIEPILGADHDTSDTRTASATAARRDRRQRRAS